MPSLFRPILAILLYPLFLLLHLTFTLTSLSLRIFQSLTTPVPHTIDIEHVSPPRHVALVLVPSAPGQNVGLGGKGGASGRAERRRKEREGLVESGKRVVQWAGERGVAELSIWDGQGLTQAALPTLLRTLTTASSLPPSPPTSPSSKPTQDASPFSRPSSPSPSPPKRTETLGGGVTSITVWPSFFGKGDSKKAQAGAGGSRKELVVHFVPPSSGAVGVVNLTKQYVKGKVEVEEVTVNKVDEDMKKQLHFRDYPDLLVIHHLTPPPFYATLLPRRAPELWGYPFWALRITEIYQHPTPMPFLHYLSFFITTLRNSSLPSIRKVGNAIGEPGKPAGNALSRDEWDGAMRAWVKVEQRLGK
ncbi:hypothetical protein L202_05828 [Cryptococcus amylolentus CBS 6039]|uniref:ditrans,polycis-polyprenyl diphosphate synthase [(2E,6E)-farnesyldiphosphate specific] n=1 Tax=Cryptococcus amylolentus CBS 6039 TaxID=1295533 RepID=A0A1E3HHK8_9TREE|nr:hypothetical protein L202_05828 [Cryptococcus amylolentus CBS 6039]ODN75832.1 hypothetical protein L202_05828 [Cryptococcus amylolentus CBS 6039]